METICQVTSAQLSYPLRHSGSRFDHFSRKEQNYLLFSKVIHLIEKHRLFMDSSIKLDDVAIRMNISKGYLSKIINKHSGKSFNALINDYRISLAKQLMTSEVYAHLNILGIAYEVGFNSKSTFYLAFSKRESVSPLQFMKSRVG